MRRAEALMNAQQMIPENLQERVRRELDAGESIRWMEQPIPRFFSGATIGAVLFAIPWTAFAVFWICGASGLLAVHVIRDMAGIVQIAVVVIVCPIASIRWLDPSRITFTREAGIFIPSPWREHISLSVRVSGPSPVPVTLEC